MNDLKCAICELNLRFVRMFLAEHLLHIGWYIYEDPHTGTGWAMPDSPLLNALLERHEGTWLCENCLEHIFREYFETLPVEELPLLINQKWPSAGCQRLYLAALQGDSKP